MSDETLSDDGSLAGQHGEDVLGQTSLEGELAEPDRRQRRYLGRLEHHGVARSQRRHEAPAGDRHREVPRHDHGDDAEGLLEGHVDAARDRDLPPEQAFRRGGVVVEDVAYVARLPPRVRDRVTGVAHLELRQFLERSVDGGGEPAQQTSPVGGRDLSPAVEGSLRAFDRGVGLLDRREVDGRDLLLGRRIDHQVARGRRRHAHILSKPRKRSQSVTAAPKAASSTSA